MRKLKWINYCQPYSCYLPVSLFQATGVRVVWSRQIGLSMKFYLKVAKGLESPSAPLEIPTIYFKLLVIEYSLLSL